MLSREYTGPLGENGAAPGARWPLADRVSRALSDARLESLSDPVERIVRLAVPAGRVDAFRWLSEQRMFPKVYWSGREDRAGLAAVGIADLREADVSEGPGSLSKVLASLPDSGVSGARYYGGARFDPFGKPDEEWTAFCAYRFVLPRFELHAGDTETTLVCNLVLPRDTDDASKIVQEIEDLSLPEGAFDALLPAPVYRVDNPDLQGWRRNVERALAAFSEGRLGKVVLARRAEFGFRGDLDPTLLLESLKAATPGCFHFYAEPESGTAFLGASPSVSSAAMDAGGERGRSRDQASWGILSGRRRAARRSVAQCQRPGRAHLCEQRYQGGARAAL